jgi:DNA invertase Pin-like site-specific DNA recombinase
MANNSPSKLTRLRRGQSGQRNHTLSGTRIAALSTTLAQLKNSLTRQPMKLIAYYRVSTRRQGNSGLGLEAQQDAVRAYARSIGATIVATFTEVESGRKSARPQLAAAIASARRNGATLCIAKLDRLARNLAFVVNLMEAKVPFVACDNPHATPLTIHIFAAIAEDEAKRISDRIKAALAVAKRRGTQLGGPDPAAAARRGTKANVKAAAAHAAEARPLAEKKRQAGWSLEQIAAHLTGKGLTTRRGKAWTPTAVHRLLMC